MPPGTGQMWLDVAGRQRLIPEHRRGEIRQTRKGEIRRPLQPPRQAFVKSIVKLSKVPRPGGNVGEIGDARSGLSNTGSGSSKGLPPPPRARETGSGSSSITEQPPPRASRLLHPQAAAATVSTSSCGHYVSMPPPSCIRWERWRLVLFSDYGFHPWPHGPTAMSLDSIVGRIDQAQFQQSFSFVLLCIFV
uniref:Uncharacterized protein n=1 Tax=Oryza barthii TaxID=65489 RepID=A0A0D3H110_9ORYZ